MGLFGWIFGGGKTTVPAAKEKGVRVAKDGTRFRDAKSGGGDVVIERKDRSAPSLGHGKKSPGHRKNRGL